VPKKLLSETIISTGASFRAQVGEVLRGAASTIETRTSKDEKNDFQFLPIICDEAILDGEVRQLDVEIRLFVSQAVLTEMRYYQVAAGDRIAILCCGYNTRGFAEWRIVANLTDE